VIQNWQQAGHKVVFTNGCFDILHPGHVDLLEQARNLGDKLVIGLNTDASVSRLKGDSRPINSEDFRGQMLAALESVDLITFFDNETPIDLILETKPDILVKGSDYQISEIVGSKEVMGYGGEVKTISLLPGFSTTNFIERIKTKTN
jgi:rfaE bifunctional protein nucleotidyltransferase chain/domain